MSLSGYDAVGILGQIKDLALSAFDEELDPDEAEEDEATAYAIFILGKIAGMCTLTIEKEIDNLNKKEWEKEKKP